MRQPQDAELLAKINAAVAAANEAETTVTTAQAELVSRSKAVGLLLLEAKKLHPAVKDFEAFLGKVQGLKLSRAYDCMRVAGGRTTDEEIRKATRDRVEKHRKKKRKKKLEGPTPVPEPQKLSVTKPDVTEKAAVNLSEDNAAKALTIAELKERLREAEAARGTPARTIAEAKAAVLTAFDTLLAMLKGKTALEMSNVVKAVIDAMCTREIVAVTISEHIDAKRHARRSGKQPKAEAA